MSVGVVALFLRLVFFHHSFGCGGDDVSLAVLTPAGAGDGVEADLVRLALFVHTGGDDAERLSDEEISGERRAGHVDFGVPDERVGLSL